MQMEESYDRCKTKGWNLDQNPHWLGGAVYSAFSVIRLAGVTIQFIGNDKPARD